MTKIEGLLKASPRRAVILAEAILFKFGARILLFFLPIRSVMKISDWPTRETSSSEMETLKIVRWALSKGGLMLRGSNRCIVKSLAGRWMLHRRGIRSQLFFGVRMKENNKLIAHAWLTSGRFEVVSAGEGYTILAGF